MAGSPNYWEVYSSLKDEYEKLRHTPHSLEDRLNLARRIVDMLLVEGSNIDYMNGYLVIDSLIATDEVLEQTGGLDEFPDLIRPNHS